MLKLTPITFFVRSAIEKRWFNIHSEAVCLFLYQFPTINRNAVIKSPDNVDPGNQRIN